MRRTWHSIVRPVFSPPREWWLCSTSSIRPLKRWAMPFVCGSIGCARRCSMHRQPGTRDARTQDLAHHGQQIEDRRFSTGQPALGEGQESRVSEPHSARRGSTRDGSPGKAGCARITGPSAAAWTASTSPACGARRGPLAKDAVTRRTPRRCQQRTIHSSPRLAPRQIRRRSIGPYPINSRPCRQKSTSARESGAPCGTPRSVRFSRRAMWGALFAAAFRWRRSNRRTATS